MKCSQCDRPAVVATGPQQVPFCVYCYHTLVDATSQQNRNLEHMMNFLMSEVSGITGIPQPVPYPETPVVKDFGAKVFNNITVSNSTIGVINTGTIQTVDVAISSLQSQGDDDVAEALRQLSQAILDNSELTQKKKSEALEILSAVSAETLAPPAQRRRAVVRPLITELSSVVQGIAALEALAAKYLPAIMTFFAG